MQEAPKDLAPDMPIELLYPFYLDADMSMAFAAALAGGIALESEEIERSEQTSEALRKLRGNLRAYAVELGGARGSSERDTAATESRLVRRHTDASIFISLHDELLRAGRLTENPDLGAIRPGDIVSMQLAPAVAPLRRVVEQTVRLLDVTVPVLGEPEAGEAPAKRGSGHKPNRAPAAQAHRPESDDGVEALQRLRNLFGAMLQDLEQTGMVDVVVTQPEGPTVIITLDERFIDGPCLELLHTSNFTIVGKVTKIWAAEEDVVNMYRRSVVALLPPLSQTITWGMLTLLGGISSSLDPEAMRLQAFQAAGISAEEAKAAEEEAAAQGATPAPGEDATQSAAADPADRIIFSNELIAAMTPTVSGPALQILPLALCS